MRKEELLRSREYWIGHIQNGLFQMVEEYKKSNKLKQKDLAELLNVSKGYVSQILNGDFDHKISKLVDLSLAFNKAPMVVYHDLDDFIKLDAVNKNPFYEPVLFIDSSLTVNVKPEQELQPILYENTNSGGAVVVGMSNYHALKNAEHSEAI